MPKFELVSDFQPTGDQPDAIAELGQDLIGCISGPLSVSLQLWPALAGGGLDAQRAEQQNRQQDRQQNTSCKALLTLTLPAKYLVVTASCFPLWVKTTDTLIDIGGGGQFKKGVR